MILAAGIQSQCSGIAIVFLQLIQISSGVQNYLQNSPFRQKNFKCIFMCSLLVALNSRIESATGFLDSCRFFQSFQNPLLSALSKITVINAFHFSSKYPRFFITATCRNSLQHCLPTHRPVFAVCLASAIVLYYQNFPHLVSLPLFSKSSLLSEPSVSAMELNRPLDDFVKESLRAKRAERQQRRKTFPRRGDRQTKEGGKNVRPIAPNANDKKVGGSTAPAASAPSSINGPKNTDKPADGENGHRRAAGGISKFRRFRKKRSGPSGNSNPGNTAKATAPNPDAAPVPSPPKNDATGENVHSPPRRSNPSFSFPKGNQRNVPSEPPYSPSPSRDYYNSPRDRGVFVAVSNLHPGVTQADVTELFETVGPLRQATLFKKHDGTSAGEAEVIFENMRDALEAIKRYNLVPLDNQPLQITLVTNHSANKGSRAGHPSRRHTDEGYPSKGDRRPLPPDNDGDRFRENQGSPERGPPDGYNRGSRRGRRQSHNRPSNGARDDRGPSPKRGRHAYMD